MRSTETKAHLGWAMTSFTLLASLAACAPNESKVLAEGAEEIALADSGALVVAISEAFFGLSIARKVDEDINKQGPSNGAYTWTKGKLSGNTTADLVVVKDKIAVDTVFMATTNLSNTSVAQRRGVNTTFWSTAEVSSGSRVSMRMTAEKGAYAVPSRTNANAALQITGINVDRNGLFRNIILNRASNEVYGQVGNIKRAVADDVTNTINAKLDSEATKAVVSGAFVRLDQLRQSLAAVPEFSNRLAMETTEQLAILGINRSDESLSLAPLSDEADLQLRLGAEELQAYLTQQLAGQSKSGAELSQILDDLVGSVQGQAAEELGQDQMTMRFLRDKPVRITIKQDSFLLVFAADEFTSDKTYKLPLTIALNYRLDADDPTKLVRDEEVVVEPIAEGDVAPRLSRRQKILLEELSEIMAAEASVNLLPEQLNSGVGKEAPLALSYLQMVEGSMTAGWSLPK